MKLFLVSLISVISFTALNANFVISEENGGQMRMAADIITGFEYGRTMEEEGYKSSFRLYKGRFGFSGKIQKDIGYKFKIRMQHVKAKDDQDFSMFKMVDQAWLSYAFADGAVKLRAGKVSPGAGVADQLDSMYPITFAFEEGSLFAGEYSLGLQLIGKLPGKFSWRFSLQNDTEDSTYRAKNQDNKYDVQFDFSGKSDKSIKEKDLSGGLRYKYGISLIHLAPTSGPERNYVSPYFLMSVSNLFLAAGLEFDLTKDKEKSSYNLALAYMAIPKFFRPGVSYSTFGKEDKMDQVVAANTTFFIDNGYFRPIFEYALEIPKKGDKSYKVKAMISLDI